MLLTSAATIPILFDVSPCLTDVSTLNPQIGELSAEALSLPATGAWSLKAFPGERTRMKRKQRGSLGLYLTQHSGNRRPYERPPEGSYWFEYPPSQPDKFGNRPFPSGYVDPFNVQIYIGPCLTLEAAVRLMDSFFGWRTTPELLVLYLRRYGISVKWRWGPYGDGEYPPIPGVPVPDLQGMTASPVMRAA